MNDLAEAARAALEPIEGISVAILPDPASTRPRHRLIGAVAVALADFSPEGRVDVVLLDDAPELLRHRILSGGVRLICRDERAWRDLVVGTLREHGDREYYRDVLRKGLHKRLTEGRSFG